MSGGGDCLRTNSRSYAYKLSKSSSPCPNHYSEKLLAKFVAVDSLEFSSRSTEFAKVLAALSIVPSLVIEMECEAQQLVTALSLWKLRAIQLQCSWHAQILTNFLLLKQLSLKSGFLAPMNLYDVIKKPVITEKSMAQRSRQICIRSWHSRSKLWSNKLLKLAFERCKKLRMNTSKRKPPKAKRVVRQFRQKLKAIITLAADSKAISCLHTLKLNNPKEEISWIHCL